MTAIVVAWRSAGFLAECLDSLLAQDHPGGVEVLVVDNDADAGTREVLARYRSRVTVVRSPTNVGFAGGVALAMAAVTTPWAFLLNDDAMAAPDAVRRLAEAATDETVGSIQAAVLLAPDAARVNSTGLEMTRDGYGFDRDWLHPWPLAVPPAAEPFGCTGAACLLRTSAVAAAGGMDPDLFLYYEDVDLAWRLRLTGYRPRFVAQATVVHRHASSSIEGSPLFRFQNERNRLLVLARNASPRLAALQWLRYPATVASLTLARGPRRAQTAVRVRAGLAALRRLPGTVGKRRRVRPRVTHREVERAFRDAPDLRPLTAG